MNDQLDGKADLAALRALAEEGRRRPLLGGRYLVAFGIAIALASAVHGAIAARALLWPMWTIALVWAGAMAAAGLFAGIGRGHRPALDIGNRVEREVWRAAGFVLGGIALSVLAFGYLTLARSGEPVGFLLFAMMPPITFGTYAIALAATIAGAQVPVLRPFAALSIAFMVATVLLAGSLWQFAVMALGALVVSVIPGFLLLSRERIAASRTGPQTGPLTDAVDG